ncbi:hypothetical protein HYV22_01060 [Candidatus Gottesmanbacteria bacterium]|nr:hypothetical protein [Candidatus Gottesmanbacteria bacterium]
MKGNKVVPHTVGLALGGFVAVMHAVWSLLVYTELAQGYLDWIFGLHFIENPYVVGEFNFSTAVILVVVTFVCGYVVGWVFGTIWNWARKK